MSNRSVLSRSELSGVPRRWATFSPFVVRATNVGCPILCVLGKGWDTRKLVSTLVDPTLRKKREGWGTRTLVARTTKS
jgi:hypothetical protein